MERSSKRIDAADAGDRISELPDEIRLHILSFLTAKSAVKTGVLSKKWARLWTSSPVLRFDQQEFVSAAHPPSSTTIRFVNFVDRVLALTSGSGSIKQFHVRWTQTFDISKAMTWLLHAMSHSVQELELIVSAPPMQPLVLPGCLFRSPSLDRLVLQASHAWIPIFLQLPTSVSLSKLRYLRLESILIPPGFLQELISNSPSLKHLKIAFGNQGDVHASAPNLTILGLHCEMVDKDSTIQISAPKLELLSCLFTVSVPEIDLGDLRSLAYGRIKCCSNQDGNGAKLFRILTSLRNAKSLILLGDAIKSLSLVPDLSKHMLLPFYNLKYLELEVLMKEENIRIVIILLKSCTNLEKLVISNSKGGGFRLDENELGYGWFTQKLDYDSSLYHLKKIEINGFLGGMDELELIKLLLQHTSTLRTMTLNCKRESQNHESWIAVLKILNGIPRSSPTAQILLPMT